MNPTKPDAGVDPGLPYYKAMNSLRCKRCNKYWPDKCECRKLPVTPAAAGDGADELHQRIMNLPGNADTIRYVLQTVGDRGTHAIEAAYRHGCRDIRHAAAELTCQIAPSTALQDENRRLRAALEDLKSAIRLTAQNWRMQNGDYPESKDDCATDLLTLINGGAKK